MLVGAFPVYQVRFKWYDVNNRLLTTMTIEAESMVFIKS